MKFKSKKYLIAAISSSLLIGSVAAITAVSCSKDNKSDLELSSEMALKKDSEGHYYAAFKTKAKKEDVQNNKFIISESSKNAITSNANILKEDNGVIVFELKLPKLSSTNDVKLIVTTSNQKFKVFNFTLSKQQLLAASSNESSNEATNSPEATKPVDNNEVKPTDGSENASSNKETSSPESQKTDQSQNQNNSSQGVDQTKPSTDSQGENGQNPDSTANAQTTDSSKPATSMNGTNNNVQLERLGFVQNIANDPMISFTFYTNITISGNTLNTFKIILEDNSSVPADNISQDHGKNQYTGTVTFPTTNKTIKIKGIKFTHNNVENTYMLSEEDSKTFTVAQ